MLSLIMVMIMKIVECNCRYILEAWVHILEPFRKGYKSSFSIKEYLLSKKCTEESCQHV